jgi:hypothetical protein
VRHEKAARRRIGFVIGAGHTNPACRKTLTFRTLPSACVCSTLSRTEKAYSGVMHTPGTMRSG